MFQHGAWTAAFIDDIWYIALVVWDTPGIEMVESKIEVGSVTPV